MSHYRRFYVSGGTYFFTVVTFRRKPLFAERTNIDLLGEAFRDLQKKRPFSLDALVLLPDHLHCIWTLPEGDKDFSNRWKMLKSFVSRRIDTPIGRDGSKEIWQPRFWEHWIRNEDDLHRHFDYIHFNPVKHGWVERPGDWNIARFSGMLKMDYTRMIGERTHQKVFQHWKLNKYIAGKRESGFCKAL